MVERRRSERIFLRVPITVQAVDQNGQLFAEQTTTLEVNRDGARIGLKNSVRLGDEVRVTNLATGFSALFRVCVQCPQSYGGSPEWGIAVSPSIAGLMSDFWGVVFEDLAEAAQPHISALLECSVCGRQELVGLSRPEYDILLQDLVLPRVCPVCRTATDWDPAEPTGPKAPSGASPTFGRATGAASPAAPTPVPQEQASAPPEANPAQTAPVRDEAAPAELAPSTAAPIPTRPEEGQLPEAGLPEVSSGLEGEGKGVGLDAQKEEAGAEAVSRAGLAEQAIPASGKGQTPAPAEANRRIARRVPVGVPILVRTSDGRTEETVTRDVSRTGLSFPTLLDLSAGDSVQIVVGHGVVASPTTQEAEVVWRRPTQKGVKALAGARFTVVREREPHRQPAVATKPEKSR
jgi:PilZ domain